MAQNDAPNSPAHGPHRSPYKRVMLKLGGEMFGGGKVGVDPDVVDNVARQIAEVAATELKFVWSSGVATSSVEHSCPSGEWIDRVPTTWACSAP